jgi:hypothetical protein
MTEAEKKLWQVWRSRQTEGYRFRLRVPTGHFVAEFVCHEARLIVEIDGGRHDPSSAPEASRTRSWKASVTACCGSGTTSAGQSGGRANRDRRTTAPGSPPPPTLPHYGGGKEGFAAFAPGLSGRRQGHHRGIVQFDREDGHRFGEAAQRAGPERRQTEAVADFRRRRRVDQDLAVLGRGAHTLR